MSKSSPFESVYRQLGARFKEYDGWLLPADFGDIEAERNALKDHCAAVDLSSFGRISLKTEQPNQIKETLSAVFELKSRSFDVDRWVWARTKNRGEILLCRIARTNGDCTILTPAGKAEILDEIIKTNSGRGVTTTDITEKTAMLGLYGPSAVKSVRGLLPFNLDDIEQGDAVKMSFFMMSFILMRGSWLGQDGLEMICPASAGPMTAGAVVKYRHKHHITPAGMECLLTAMEQMESPL
jgi:aminomethyltransferase